MDMSRKGLVQARKRKSWSLVEASAFIGCGRNTLNRWERGQAHPQPSYVRRLCEVYNTTPVTLDLLESNLRIPRSELAEGAMTEHISASLKQDLTVQLMKVVLSPGNTEEIQAQVNQAIENYTVIIEHDLDQVITRRNALRSLVLLPIEVCSLAALGARRLPVKEVLTQCAAGITACWYLRRGKELPLANDALSLYFPALKTIAESSLPQRKDAASLMSQALILKAKLVNHIVNTESALEHLQQAIHYSNLAESPLLTVLAWRTMAATYYLTERWQEAMKAAEEARKIMVTQPTSRALPLDTQSFVYAGLAIHEAVNGKKQEALDALRLMHKTYQNQSDSAPHWTMHSWGNVIHTDGLTHYHLGDYKPALSSLSSLQSVQTLTLTEGIQHLLDLCRAEVSRDDQARDMKLCIDLCRRGISGAIDLRSEQRFKEARRTYEMLHAAWPSEPRVKELRDLLVHW